MRRGRAWGRALALGLGAVLSLGACGGEETPTAMTRPMSADAPATPSVPEGADPPRVRSIRFEPATPLAGRAARAVADLDWNGRNVRLEYAFSAGGRTLTHRQDRVDLARARPGDRLEVTITPYVDDRAGTPVSHAVRLRAPAPRVMGVSFDPPQGLTAGTTVEARPIVEDGDPSRTTHRFEWIVNDRRTGHTDRTLDTTDLMRGDRIRVEVVAQDGPETSEPFTSETIVLENAPPTLVRGPLTVTEDGRLDTRLEARDADGDAPVAFALVSGPAGLDLTPGGHLTWADAGRVPGRHAIEIELTDPQGASRRTRFSLDVGSPAAPAD